MLTKILINTEIYFLVAYYFTEKASFFKWIPAYAGMTKDNCMLLT
jgi:hypothetical protein